MAHKYDTVDDYISTCSAEVAPLMEQLRSFIHATLPGATEEMQYGAPIFLNEHGVPVIYLFGSKTHANFGFLKSTELSDPDGMLKRIRKAQQTHPHRSRQTDRRGHPDRVRQAMRKHQDVMSEYHI